MSGKDGDHNGAGPRQLQIWDAAIHELPLGQLVGDGIAWDVYVLIEQVAADLFRGRLSFRDGDRRFDTVAIIVEESEAEVVRKATDMPRAMLRQLLISLQDG